MSEYFATLFPLSNGKNGNKRKNGKNSSVNFGLWNYIFRFSVYFRYFRFEKLTTALSIILMLTTGAKAGEPNGTDGLALHLRAGYSIGASTPLGIPATIRELNSFSLSPNVTIGFDATLPLVGHASQRDNAVGHASQRDNRAKDRWGLLTGLRFEHKGMDVTVTTKGYHMAMVKGGEELEGVYTGRVEQHVKAWMFTVPLQATYNLSQHWQLRLGPYLSLLTAKAFNGNVSDGYLRKDNPTGQKIEMGHEADERATYDFSSDMRRLQAGLDLGTHWQVAQRIGLGADLSWGLTGLMRSSFKTVEQTLYPIYGTVSVSYQL